MRTLEAAQLQGLRLARVHEQESADLLAQRVQAWRREGIAVGTLTEAALACPCEHLWHILWYEARAGGLGWQMRDGVLWLEYLYLQPPYQNLGIGSALMQLLCRQADLLACPIMLKVRYGSRTNCYFARFGFALLDISDGDCLYLRHAYIAKKQD